MRTTPFIGFGVLLAVAISDSPKAYADEAECRAWCGAGGAASTVGCAAVTYFTLGAASGFCTSGIGAMQYCMDRCSPAGNAPPWPLGPTEFYKDFNGDDRTDVIQVQPDGRALVSLSSGNGFTDWEQWGTGHRFSDRFIDVNGDKRVDVVQIQPDGRMLVALSSNGKFEEWVNYGSGYSARDQYVQLDGKLGVDIVQIQADGRALVRVAGGEGYAEWKLWGTGHRITDRFADLDGDGRTDVFQTQDMGVFS